MSIYTNKQVNNGKVSRFVEVKRPSSITLCRYRRLGSQVGNKSSGPHNHHSNSMKDIVLEHAKCGSRYYLMEGRSDTPLLVVGLEKRQTIFVW